MRTKKTPPFKRWLTTSYFAFGISCGCTLPFTQNLAQSALLGLATVPGSVTTMMVRFRQRKRQANLQMERERQQLLYLQQQISTLNRQLQLKDKNRQAIDTKTTQLQRLAANLSEQIDKDRIAHEKFEIQLTSLNEYCQERQTFATKLDRSIHDKQALLLEVDTDFHGFKLQISQLQADRVRLQAEIDADRAKVNNLQAEIAVYNITKQELTKEIDNLEKSKKTGAIETVDREHLEVAIERKHTLLHQIDIAISERLQVEQDAKERVEKLEKILTQIEPDLLDRERQLADIRSQLLDREAEVKIKQKQLTKLETEIVKKRTEIEGYDRSLKIVQLELSSKQGELENLELQVDAKQQAIDNVDPWQSDSLGELEPHPPKIDRQIAPLVAGEWQDRFSDNPHLSVLQHIEKHGTITEAEASSKLGNARSVRQFANKLEEYTRHLPFAIRVESSPTGNRYIKENHN